MFLIMGIWFSLCDAIQMQQVHQTETNHCYQELIIYL